MQKKKNLKGNKLKQTKGITLIALVITIIVLLILAGVTINLTIGENGIFKTAQLAAKNYTNAQEKELVDLTDFTNTANDQIKGEEKVQLVTEITLNKTEINLEVGSSEKLTSTISPSNATNKSLTWTSSNEDIATVSEGTITAVAPGTATITVTAGDGSGKSANCNVTVPVPVPVELTSKAKPGDYVEYNGGNGYTGLWQVLYNDSTYGLQIISSTTVTDSFYIGGESVADARTSYNNYVNTLNTECRKYVNSSYATKGRCVGSNPLSPDDAAGYVTLYGQQVRRQDSNYETDYNAMSQAKNQNNKGINNIGKYYYLASRTIEDWGDSAIFCYRDVDSAGNAVGGTLLYWKNAGEYTVSGCNDGIRPVITLKSGIKTSLGNGSEKYPYKLIAP